MLICQFICKSLNKIPFWWLYSVNSLNPDQENVGPDLDPNCLQSLSVDDKLPSVKKVFKYQTFTTLVIVLINQSERIGEKLRYYFFGLKGQNSPLMNINSSLSLLKEEQC